MKARNQVLSLGLVALIVFGGLVLAREGRHGEVGGVFIRLVERRVGDKEAVGLVVRPFERDEHVVLLVPRENEDLLAALRMFREGQRVEAAFERDGEHLWITRLESRRIEKGEGERRVEVERMERRGDRDPVREERRIMIERRVEGERRDPDRPRERREGDRPREGREPGERNPLAMMAAHLQDMSMQLREFAGHMRRMEMEIRELRMENERLRNVLREHGLLEGGRERGPMERRERQRDEIARRERERDEMAAYRERETDEMERREREEIERQRGRERREDMERRELEERRRNAEREEREERRREEER
ncbi:MAG: hypothetical protein ACYS8Z_14175 [Planctomycetota bacterium]|jgi:hypothetical protein